MRSMCNCLYSFRFTVLVFVLALVSCGGSVDDDLPLAFNAMLGGAEEVPQVSTGASATGIVTVDADRRALTASVSTSGIADNAVHIHQGAPGVTGPVVFTLAKEADTAIWTGRTALTDAQLATLRAGNFYFDVHSPAYPGSEIRGQIVERMPSPEQLFPLLQAREQSALAELQLRQIEEIDDWEKHHFTGIGIGIRLGF